MLALWGCAAGPAATGGGSTSDGDSDQPDQPQEPEENLLEREIEEADIVKLQDGYFYLANRYRGLRIIDARTVERPELVGGLPLAGRGVELYVDEERVYMVSSADYFSCAGEPVAYDDSGLDDTLLTPDYEGSRIAIVDVSDPAQPAKITHFDMDGYITATRRVGDVLYATGNYVGTPEDEPPDAGTDGDPGDEDDGGPPPPSTTGPAATVAEDGTAVATVEMAGGVTATYSVSGATPGAFVQLTVFDGNVHGHTNGISGENALDLVVRVDGELAEGEYTATLEVRAGEDVLDDLGLSVDNVGVYRHLDAADFWFAPSTHQVRGSESTEVLGDYGFYVADAGSGGDDGEGDSDPADDPATSYAVWAVVDRLGDFVLGERVETTVEVAPAESDFGQVSVEPPAGPYEYGQTVTLTAVADDAYAFDRWTALPPLSEEVEPGVLEVTLTGDLEIGAVFEPYVPPDIGPHVFVVSIDISDPQAIRIVDRVNVPGESLDIHVTPEAIFVLGDDPDTARTTRVSYVDISDPDGAIEQRDVFRVPGTILNRFFVDVYHDTFRIVTEDLAPNGFTPVVALYLYDLRDPDSVTRRGRLVIDVGESLRSVRFDGDRAYAVTFFQVDPLFVLDLSDPDEPIVAGELEVPGWSTHLVPLDDRLVAIGFDDTAGFRPAVALYDVSRPEFPRRMSIIRLGDAWSFDTTSEANVDEKALKVLEGEELILVPISSYDEEQADFVDHLQLIDLLPERLVERGLIDHRGLVRRAGVLDARLWVLSDEAFQVADIDDRDDVQSIDTLDIITEQELLDAGLEDCVDSARWDGFPVDFWFGPGGDVVFFTDTVGPCGAAGILPLITLAGIFGLRLARGRRR